MAVKAVYIELLEEAQAPCLKVKLEETKAELVATQTELEECRNTQTVPLAADWQFGNVTVMKSDDGITAVITVTDKNMSESADNSKIPNYINVDFRVAQFEVLKSETVGAVTTSIVKINGDVQEGSLIDIQANSVSSRFRLKSIGNGLYAGEKLEGSIGLPV